MCARRLKAVARYPAAAQRARSPHACGLRTVGELYQRSAPLEGPISSDERESVQGKENKGTHGEKQTKCKSMCVLGVVCVEDVSVF